MKQFLQRILQEIKKKIILGTPGAWSMSRLSQLATEPAYYILDCRILRLCRFLNWSLSSLLILTSDRIYLMTSVFWSFSIIFTFGQMYIFFFFAIIKESANNQRSYCSLLIQWYEWWSLCPIIIYYFIAQKGFLKNK